MNTEPILLKKIFIKTALRSRLARISREMTVYHRRSREYKILTRQFTITCEQLVYVGAKVRTFEYIN